LCYVDAVNASELAVLEGLALGKTLAQIGGELSVGESAVSRTLSQLERTLGLQIVDRQRHRLRLTPVGRDLAVAATRAAQHLRELDELAEQYRRGEQGRLRMLSISSAANYLLPYVINDFLQQFPRSDIQLDVEEIHEMWPLFSRGGYDIGIGVSAGPADIVRNVLPAAIWSWEPLYEDPLVLFISAGNPLGQRRDLTLGSLGGETFVGMYGEEFWTRFLEKAALSGLHVGRVVEFHGIEGVKRMVESGPGIGVHIRSAIAREVQEGRLRILDLPELLPPHRYVLAHRSSQGERSLATEFCNLVRSRVPGLSTAGLYSAAAHGASGGTHQGGLAQGSSSIQAKR